MENTYSTTGNNPNHMCYYLDFLGNMTLNKYHSGVFFGRGFVVDNKSDSVISVRNKGKS